MIKYMDSFSFVRENLDKVNVISNQKGELFYSLEIRGEKNELKVLSRKTPLNMKYLGYFNNSDYGDDSSRFNSIENGYISKGAFGSVFKVYDQLFNNHRAIKLFYHSEEMSSTHVMEKEVKYIKKFNGCEFLVNMIDYFTQSSYGIIVFEYCDNNLLDYLQTRVCFSEIEIKKFLNDISNGLHNIHNRSIVHNDLKPQNILLKKSDDFFLFKICDFGSCSSINKKEKNGLIITRWYRAPEIVYCRKTNLKYNISVNFSVYSDMWSLGCILFELLTLQNFTPIDNDIYHQVNIVKNIFHRYQNCCIKYKFHTKKISIKEYHICEEHFIPCLINEESQYYFPRENCKKDFIDIESTKKWLMNFEELIQAVLDSELYQLSSLLKNIIKNLLTFNYDKRYLPIDILEHEFIKE